VTVYRVVLRRISADLSKVASELVSDLRPRFRSHLRTTGTTPSVRSQRPEADPAAVRSR